MSDETVHVQHKIRQSALRMHDEFQSIKSFEKEIKLREKEVLKNNTHGEKNEIPLRSNIEGFSDFHTDESTKKRMNLAQDLEPELSSYKEVEQEDSKARANEFKEKGNSLVKLKNYASAIEMYSNAIEMFSKDAVYYSNRSQCYLSLEKYHECIVDATKAIELDGNSSKAYYRKITALEKLGDDLRALQTSQLWMLALPNDQIAKNTYDRIHNKIIEDTKRKEREKIKWSKISDQVQFIEKMPHEQSKRLLRKIPVHMKKSHSPIPAAVIDKIFNNNTGETLLEPETDSKLFKSNFLSKNIVKPVSVNPNISEIIEDKSKINEHNEKLKASNDVNNERTSALSTLEELESLKSHQIRIPSSGPQFYAAWKEFERDDTLRFLYLKNFANNGNIGSLLGAQLDSDMLSEIIKVIRLFFVRFKIPYLKLLHDLCKNPEITILAMLLEQEDKEKLNELLSFSMLGGDNNDNILIEEIKRRFQMKEYWSAQNTKKEA